MAGIPNAVGQFYETAKGLESWALNFNITQKSTGNAFGSVTNNTTNIINQNAKPATDVTDDYRRYLMQYFGPTIAGRLYFQMLRNGSNTTVKTAADAQVTDFQGGTFNVTHEGFATLIDAVSSDEWTAMN